MGFVDGVVVVLIVWVCCTTLLVLVCVARAFDFRIGIACSFDCSWFVKINLCFVVVVFGCGLAGFGWVGCEFGFAWL